MEINKILIIDDEPDKIEAIKLILTDENYNVITADNGITGITLAENEQPNLILLDIRMPELNGFEVCKILKDKDTTKEIPIIFFTASNNSKSILTAFRSGASDYITLPIFEKDELLTRIKNNIELKLFKNKIKESEEDYKILFNSIDDCVWILNLEGKILKVNKACCEKYKYSEEKFLQMKITDIDNFESAKSAPERIKKLMTEGSLIFETEHKLQNGKILQKEVNARLINYQGKPSILAIDRDITNRKQLEQQLIYSERLAAVGQLTAGISHEFNNLLTIILNTVQISEFEILNGKYNELNNDLNVIKESVMRAANIVSQMIALSGSCSYNKKVYDIESVISEIIEVQKNHLNLENIDVIFKSDTTEKILIDKSQISQVFLNMFINSRHAIQPKSKGTIKINITETDNQIKITFEDDGIGIEKNDIPKIFTPFFTTKGAFAKDFLDIQGVGLGLAVCLKIIENHKGNIKVNSEKNKGTIFTITLPAYKEKIENTNKPVPTQSNKDFLINKNINNILIIDDEKEILNIFKRLIFLYGVKNIQTAESGTDALKLFSTNKNKFDLVFLDMMLPDMDGLRIFEELKKIDQSLKIVFISGKVNINEKDIIELGGAGLIKKPFLIEDIEKYLTAAI